MKKLLSLLVISGAVLAALFFLTSLPGNGSGGSPAPTVNLQPATSVQQGVLVSIEYTLTDEAGKVIESNVGKEPLTYIHGAGQIVRGLEKELAGMKVGEQKKIQVKPEEGYGLPDPNAVQEILKDKIPAEAQQVMDRYVGVYRIDDTQTVSISRRGDILIGARLNTSTAMCMLLRPVSRIRARVSTRSPIEIGRSNWIPPT